MKKTGQNMNCLPVNVNRPQSGISFVLDSNFVRILQANTSTLFSSENLFEYFLPENAIIVQKQLCKYFKEYLK